MGEQWTLTFFHKGIIGSSTWMPQLEHNTRMIQQWSVCYQLKYGVTFLGFFEIWFEILKGHKGLFTVSHCISDCDCYLLYDKMDTMYFNKPIHS